MNEEQSKLMEAKLRKKAEYFYEKYPEQMELYENSLYSKTKDSLDHFDIYSLGTQLNQFDEYMQFCEAESSTDQLGRIPKVAHNVITAVQGQSIVPAISAVQPIEEEQGLVYFRKVLAEDTKGNLGSGDTLVDPRTGLKTPQAYASNYLDWQNVEATVAADLDYDFTLPVVPPRSQTLKVRLAASPDTVYGQDIGPAEGGDPNVGRILGVGLSGTVTYSTGAIHIDFTADPGASNIQATWQQNYELANDIPQISEYLDSKFIQARVFALKGTISMLRSFALQKRFGESAEAMLSKQLVVHINREIGGALINMIKNSAVGLTQFDKSAPAGVSYFEHKQTLADKYADAEAVLVGNAGRGQISHIIAGREIAAIIGTLPGFTKLSDGKSLGAHIYGTWNGVVVIRVNEQALLDSKKSYCFYKAPGDPFEAATVYSPYMPLAVTSTLPLAPNPLSNMKAAAVWAGVDVMIGNFITELEMTIS